MLFIGHMERFNTPCGQNAECQNVTALGTYKYQCAINCYILTGRCFFSYAVKCW